MQFVLQLSSLVFHQCQHPKHLMLDRPMVHTPVWDCVRLKIDESLRVSHLVEVNDNSKSRTCVNT